MWHVRDLLPARWRKQPIPIEVHRSHAGPASERRQDEGTALPAERALARLGSIFEPWYRPHPLSGRFDPAVDLVDRRGAIELYIELPGLEAKDIDLTFSDDWLSIRGERRETSEGSEGHAHWREIRYGTFERSIPLPPGLDVDASEASLARGVLHVRLPRRDADSPRARSVPIRTA